VVIALVAGALGGSPRSRLVPFAVWTTAACWFVGMVVAIVFERPIV